MKLFLTKNLFLIFWRRDWWWLFWKRIFSQVEFEILSPKLISLFIILFKNSFFGNKLIKILKISYFLRLLYFSVFSIKTKFLAWKFSPNFRRQLSLNFFSTEKSKEKYIILNENSRRIKAKISLCKKGSLKKKEKLIFYQGLKTLSIPKFHMENAAVTEVQRKLFDVDKLCFTKCVKEAANKFKTKEEMCLGKSFFPYFFSILISIF